MSEQKNGLTGQEVLNRALVEVGRLTIVNQFLEEENQKLTNKAEKTDALNAMAPSFDSQEDSQEQTEVQNER